MIISRSPLRITLGGGGTDLPSYYREHEGFLLSAAIDKYVYVSVSKPFVNKIFLKYAELEEVGGIDQIKHPIIRETLNLIEPNCSQIEITSFADIPAGTGLGSSGSFTTALIQALNAHANRNISREELAELACYIEINLLKEPIGKQDQYIAAYGGVSCFTFKHDDSVDVNPLLLTKEVLFDLEDSILLFFTGYSRSAGSILKDQKQKSEVNDREMIDNLHFVKKLGYDSKLALINGDIELFGNIMNEHWEYKRHRSAGMSNSNIDHWYKTGIANGAVGGKLVGAGGGGFLMFVTKNPKQLRDAMALEGLEEVRFRFDFEGSRSTIFR